MLLAAPIAPISTPKPVIGTAPPIVVGSNSKAPDLASAGATPPTPPAAGGSAPAGAPDGQPDPARILAMPVASAVTEAAKLLTAISGLTIGGGTKEGAAAATQAATMLTDSSLLVQLAHRNGIQEAKRLSPELEINLMRASVSLAAAAGQVMAVGASSPKPVALKELFSQPAKETTDVLAALRDHVARNSQAAPPSSNGYL